MKTKKSYKFWDRVSGWSKAESAANSNLVKYITTIFGIHIMPDDPCFGDTNSFSALLVRFLRFVRIMPTTYFFSVNEIEREIAGAGFTIIESTDISKLPERFIVAVK